jgi:Sec-independent protein translocase protein TatA
VFNLGMGEITVILLLALIFIGPKKLPDLAAGLGKLIKEIRKATSDVKNEISLDETFRKPFEDLRDAVTLHPDELKRRDQWQKDSEAAAKRAAEEAAKFALEEAGGASTPPDGLADHVTTPMPGTGARPAVPKLPEPHGPNDTIVQVAPPRGATLEDIPTPPPEVAPTPPVTKPATPAAAKPMPAAAKPAPDAAKATPDAAKPTLNAAKPTPDAAKPTPNAAKPTPDAAKPTPNAAKPTPDAAKAAMPQAGLFPMGTVPRAAKPVAPSAPPANGEGAANITQILREEDLLPNLSSGGPPPPPPHLPGLRPAGAPRPNRITPPPVPPVDKKKP